MTSFISIALGINSIAFNRNSSVVSTSVKGSTELNKIFFHFGRSDIEGNVIGTGIQSIIVLCNYFITIEGAFIMYLCIHFFYLDSLNHVSKEGAIGNNRNTTFCSWVP